jgi:hypothetical protein
MQQSNGVGSDTKLCVYKTVGGTRIADDVAALKAGVHVVVGTPGRVMALLGLERIGRLFTEKLKLLVFDEATLPIVNEEGLDPETLEPVTAAGGPGPDGSGLRPGDVILMLDSLPVKRTDTLSSVAHRLLQALTCQVSLVWVTPCLSCHSLILNCLRPALLKQDLHWPLEHQAR